MNLKYKPFVLSLSFGNHLKGDGGTDKLITEHQNVFNQHGYSYVQIAPVGKNAQEMKVPCFTLAVDGVYYRIVSEERLSALLHKICSEGHPLKAIFIHHLFKFRMDTINRMCQSTDAPIFYYLHDYYSICLDFKLLGKRDVYCGDATVSATKCEGCPLYGRSLRHIKDVKDFYKAFQGRLWIIAPSEAALNIWKNSFGELRLKTKVIPHQKLRGRYHKIKRSDDELRVAYIGSMTVAKGSGLWEEFINKVVSSEPKYRPYYFGVSDNNFSNVKKINVMVSAEHPDAMVEALRENQIDVVFLWSIWPETYSYTYFEAMAADCYIITNTVSGNITHMVKTNGGGSVFKTSSDALDYLRNYDAVRSDVDTAPSIAPARLEINEDVVSLLPDNNYRFNKYGSIHFISEIKAFIYDVLYSKKHSKDHNI